MARPKRHDAPGAVHHVWARGVDRLTIFRDEKDRRYHLDLLGYVVREWHWDCLDYSLMGNHLHLVVRTRRETLAAGMQRLHWLYAVYFNERHRRTGHLFERRYGSSRLWTSERLDYVLKYVANNPVEAGFATTPEAWPWGSAAARVSGDRPRWLATRHTIAAVRAGLAYDAPAAAA